MFLRFSFTGFPEQPIIGKEIMLQEMKRNYMDFLFHIPIKNSLIFIVLFFPLLEYCEVMMRIMLELEHMAGSY